MVIGEGGSGGALAIGVGDRVLMMQNSINSVITPEGCATILFRDASLADRTAESLKLTAQDLLGFKVIDEVIPEPPGGAHRDPQTAGENLGKALKKHLGQLKAMKPDRMVDDRYRKLRVIGEFTGGSK